MLLKILSHYLIIIVFVFLIQSCNKNIYKFDYHVSLNKYYELFIDSLNKKPNDYIIYYKQCFCQSFSKETIYILINKDSIIEVSKIDNIKQEKYIATINTDFTKIQQLLDIQDTLRRSYPQISMGDFYRLNLRIHNLIYSFSSEYPVYDNQVLNYVKSILFDLEIENRFQQYNQK